MAEHEQFDLILRGGTVATPSGIVSDCQVGVKDKRIVAIGDLPQGSATEEIDCSGLHVLPGIIDTQVHFREPGGEHKECLETGMRAAAKGGVCSLFEMPNTNPLTTSPEAIADKLRRAAKNPWTNYAFFMGGTEGNAAQLGEWEKTQGVCGIKVFMGSSTGDLLTATDPELEAVLANGNRVVAVHAEDEAMMVANYKEMLAKDEQPPVTMHPVWRSAASCLSATTRLLKAARKFGRRVHVLHITTAEEMELLAQNKDIASVEVLANHLSLHAPDCYEQLGSLAQQNPPIREKHHQDALWKAINEGVVDIIGSDHAPHTLEEKAQAYPRSPSGTPGVQTLVPIMLDHVNNGKLSLERLLDLLCYGPQRIYQISNKGRIARGYDADFTIVDMKANKTITNAQQESRAGWTPFDGKRVSAWPIATIIGGQCVMRDDELLNPVGQALQFRECLAHGG